MSNISWAYKKVTRSEFNGKYVEFYEYCSKYCVRVGDGGSSVDILTTTDKEIAEKFVKDLESIIALTV